MLTFFVLAGCLAGCGGGGGSSSSSSPTGHYVGSFSASDSTSGSADFTIVSGGRTTATLVENTTGRDGILVGRIIDGEITGSVKLNGKNQSGFTGTVQQQGGSLTLHLTYLGTGTTVTYTLAPGA
jgi:hypothetical protein